MKHTLSNCFSDQLFSFSKDSKEALIALWFLPWVLNPPSREQKLKSPPPPAAPLCLGTTHPLLDFHGDIFSGSHLKCPDPSKGPHVGLALGSPGGVPCLQVMCVLLVTVSDSCAGRSSTGCTTWWATCTCTLTANPSSASTAPANSPWRGTWRATWKSSTASWSGASTLKVLVFQEVPMPARPVGNNWAVILFTGASPYCYGQKGECNFQGYSRVAGASWQC